MYLGFSTWAMPDLPIDPVIPHLAKLGFDAIEICVLPRFSTALAHLDQAERNRIAQLLRDHNLKLSSVSSYIGMMDGDAAQFAENRDYLNRTVDLAAEWRDLWVPTGQPPVVVSGLGATPAILPRGKANSSTGSINWVNTPLRTGSTWPLNIMSAMPMRRRIRPCGSCSKFPPLRSR